MQLISRLWRDEDGQDLIEYALLAAFIALAALLAMRAVGTNINTLFNNVSTQLQNASGGGGGGS
jgi:pilus assembly protein Flp/PilA